jgi:hypothetical protein
MASFNLILHNQSPNTHPCSSLPKPVLLCTHSSHTQAAAGSRRRERKKPADPNQNLSFPLRFPQFTHKQPANRTNQSH